MFEKVNPSHPDKVADRIAGAVVDIAYETQIDPKVAVEVLIGHGVCHIIAETSADINRAKVISAVHRIAGDLKVYLVVVPQDEHLARNQADAIRCGDNGIFKGVPVTNEQKHLSSIARSIYEQYPWDGKYIMNGDELVICQSNAATDALKFQYPGAVVNPLGDWTGGTDVDTGATNRKLGSDMLNLHATFTKGTVEFRLFQFDAPADGKQNGLHAGQLKSYIQLCLALSQMAKTVRTASPKPQQNENPK